MTFEEARVPSFAKSVELEMAIVRVRDCAEKERWYRFVAEENRRLKNNPEWLLPLGEKVVTRLNHATLLAEQRLAELEGR